MGIEDLSFTAADYDPEFSGKILSHAAALIREIGAAAHHIVLFGGLVPSLLVPNPEEGYPRHVGTRDIDVCLSTAIVDGDTGTYERIDAALRRLGYRKDRQNFRWRGGEDRRLIVEFFCPEAPGRVAWKTFNPLRAENPRAKQVMGNKLGAWVLPGADVLHWDVVDVPTRVELPDGSICTVTFRVTGVAAFLCAKASALVGRNKRKDAYDVVWILDALGPEAAADAVRATRIYGSQEWRKATQFLADQFLDTNATGARNYAAFVGPTMVGLGDPAIRAVAAVGIFLDALQ